MGFPRLQCRWRPRRATRRLLQAELEQIRDVYVMRYLCNVFLLQDRHWMINTARPTRTMLPFIPRCEGDYAYSVQEALALRKVERREPLVVTRVAFDR